MLICSLLHVFSNYPDSENLDYNRLYRHISAVKYLLLTKCLLCFIDVHVDFSLNFNSYTLRMLLKRKEGVYQVILISTRFLYNILMFYIHDFMLFMICKESICSFWSIHPHFKGVPLFNFCCCSPSISRLNLTYIILNISFLVKRKP